MSIIYRSPNSKKEFEKYYEFRWKMLREPLNLPRGSEQDELEEHSFHITAYNKHEIIGVGRLHIEPDNTARIRYMAVHDDYQNQDVGSRILKELEQHARDNHLRECRLYARESVILFYSKNGYVIKGKSKSELSQLKHERMEKQLV